MNKDVAALLCIDHAKLTNFRPIVPRHVNQSPIANLSAHLGVKRRAIENDLYFVRFFARENGFNNRFGLEKIVTKKFVGAALSSPLQPLISSFFRAFRARSRCSSISFSKPPRQRLALVPAPLVP